MCSSSDRVQLPSFVMPCGKGAKGTHLLLSSSRQQAAGSSQCRLWQVGVGHTPQPCLGWTEGAASRHGRGGGCWLAGWLAGCWHLLQGRAEWLGLGNCPCHCWHSASASAWQGCHACRHCPEPGNYCNQPAPLSRVSQLVPFPPKLFSNLHY